MLHESREKQITRLRAAKVKSGQTYSMQAPGLGSCEVYGSQQKVSSPCMTRSMLVANNTDLSAPQAFPCLRVVALARRVPIQHPPFSGAHPMVAASQGMGWNAAGPARRCAVLAAPPDLWSDAHGVLTPLVVAGLELRGSTHTSSPSLQNATSIDGLAHTHSEFGSARGGR